MMNLFSTELCHIYVAFTVAGESIRVQLISILTIAVVAADGVSAELGTVVCVVTAFINICWQWEIEVLTCVH